MKSDTHDQPRATRRLSPSRFLDYLLYVLVRIIEEVVNLVPEAAAMAAGRFGGRLVYVLLSDRREAALENLTIAFGREQPREWIVKTARANFEHVGMMAVEFFRLRRWSHDEIVNRIVIEGRLPYNLIMNGGRQGICILYSHFGAFEVGAVLAKLLVSFLFMT